jgi:hypothetical protein
LSNSFICGYTASIFYRTFIFVQMSPILLSPFSGTFGALGAVEVGAFGALLLALRESEVE